MEVEDETFGCVCRLVDRYALKCGRSRREVARALLASRTLAKHGYTEKQGGALTEDQGQAACRLLEYWIGAST